MTAKRPVRNVAASVSARLHAISSAGDSYQLLIGRYARERLLYRLSRSAHREDFILKGAVLFQVWNGQPHRVTRDVDLLGRGRRATERLAGVFRDICQVEVEDDGLVFLPESIQAMEIRGSDEYGGIRVTLTARLGTAVIPMQVDVGFGDVVRPRVEVIEFPALLPIVPAPLPLRAYPPETVIAEKTEAMVRIGFANTPLKDFYDVWTLSLTRSFDGAVLGDAIGTTFGHRGTPLPDAVPVAFTDEFAMDAVKRVQWAAFTRKANAAAAAALDEVVPALRAFLMPPLVALRERGSFAGGWPAGGPWSSAVSAATEAEAA